jgi:DNA replication protein DnaC
LGIKVVDQAVERLRKIATENIRYERQLSRVRTAGKQTSCISDAVSKSLDNITSGSARSFVIYGEPQSGKTEMMICLTAKLIDSGFSVVVHLLNDGVQLLQQNLERFQRSGLSPAARNFSEVMDPSISLKVGQHVIFAKRILMTLES